MICYNPFDFHAGVAELVDARDLKSLGGYPLCGFESRPRHSVQLELPLDHISKLHLPLAGVCTLLISECHWVEIMENGS